MSKSRWHSPADTVTKVLIVAEVLGFVAFVIYLAVR